MKNLLHAARTKEALKSYLSFNDLNRDDYVVLPINDKVRKSETLKSLDSRIADTTYKWLIIKSEFVRVSGESNIQLDIPKLKENAYGQEMNSPDVEKVGDKHVKEGTVKSLSDKLNKLNLTTEEKQLLDTALKSLDGVTNPDKAEKIGKQDEFVSEMETKSAEADEHKADEGHEKTETETKGMPEQLKEAMDGEGQENKSVEAEDKKDEMVQKSLMSNFNRESDRLESLLKSCNSLSDTEPVFRDRASAKSFQNKYNSQNEGKRAVISTVSIQDVRHYGSKAKVKVIFE